MDLIGDNEHELGFSGNECFNAKDFTCCRSMRVGSVLISQNVNSQV
jgi:hypothetical protein